MQLELPEAPCELSSSSEKDEDLTSCRPAAASLRVDRSKKENHEPSPPHPATVLGSSSSSDASAAQGPRPRGRGLGRHEHNRAASPNGCPDSTDTESTAEEQSGRAPAQIAQLHHPTPSSHHSRSTASPRQAKEPGWERAAPAPPALLKKSPGSLPASTESVQVLDRDGQPVRSFRCLHCHILFLDYVMFTIHMGCHGFHRPFECNICGHSSRDRYEFSSHISRGEHQVG